jgi:GPH family glycoside/pentoside/hexuronide:cation symporter
MTPSPPDPSLPWHQRWSYGLPAFTLAVVGIPVYVHIPKFYTDVVGINIAWVGSILMLARLLDAFSDPLMGIVSDRTRTRMGRRRPFILWGSIGLAAAICLLFAPPRLDGMPVMIWFAGSIFGLFLFWTVVTVPYEALGPALTKDYTERTALFGVRDGLLIAGTLFAAASPALIEALQGEAASDAGLDSGKNSSGSPRSMRPCSSLPVGGVSGVSMNPSQLP